MSICEVSSVNELILTWRARPPFVAIINQTRCTQCVFTYVDLNSFPVCAIELQHIILPVHSTKENFSMSEQFFYGGNSRVISRRGS